MKSHFSTFALLPLLAAVTACGNPETPYSFVAQKDAAPATDAAARTLAAAGYPVDGVDRATGIVTSKWLAHGVPMQDGTQFVRRFTITVAPSGAASNIVVRMDFQRCPPGGYSVGNMQVMGTCEPIDRIFGGDQEDINALGDKLRATLASGG